MRQSQLASNAGLIGCLTVIILALVAIWGYIANIVAIAHTVGGDFTALLACRLVGMFVFPMGSIMGLFV